MEPKGKEIKYETVNGIIGITKDGNWSATSQSSKLITFNKQK